MTRARWLLAGLVVAGFSTAAASLKPEARSIIGFQQEVDRLKLRVQTLEEKVERLEASSHRR